MRKKDLKNRMVVESRRGDRGMIIDGYVMFEHSTILLKEAYNEDLCFLGGKNHDIVKVFDRVEHFKDAFCTNNKPIWEKAKFRKIDFFEAMQVVKLGHAVYLKDDNGELTRSVFIYEGEINIRTKSGDNFKFSMSDTAKDWYVNEHVKMSNKIFLVDKPFSDCEDPYDTYDHIVVSANSEKEAKSIVVNTYGKDLEYYDVRELSSDKNGILFSTIRNE